MNIEEGALTVEMPDQHSDNERNNGSEDHHTDHSPDFPRTLFLLELFVIRRWQELDIGLPVFVLEDTERDSWMSEWMINT